MAGSRASGGWKAGLATLSSLQQPAAERRTAPLDPAQQPARPYEFSAKDAQSKQNYQPSRPWCHDHRDAERQHGEADYPDDYPPSLPERRDPYRRHAPDSSAQGRKRFRPLSAFRLAADDDAQRGPDQLDSLKCPKWDQTQKHIHRALGERNPLGLKNFLQQRCCRDQELKGQSHADDPQQP